MGRGIYVSKVSELEDHETTPFTVEGREVAIARLGERIYAIGDTCTHEQCSLSEGVLEGERVICPCHGSEFDLATGEALCLPAEEPVKRFETVVEGDELYLQL